MAARLLIKQHQLTVNMVSLTSTWSLDGPRAHQCAFTEGFVHAATNKNRCECCVGFWLRYFDSGHVGNTISNLNALLVWSSGTVCVNEDLNRN